MIGERLKKLRKDKGMTQADLAQFLSLSKISISQYENNKNSPTIETLVKMAKFFNISLDYLVGLNDEPYSFKREEECILHIPTESPVIVKQIAVEFIDFINNRYSGKDE